MWAFFPLMFMVKCRSRIRIKWVPWSVTSPCCHFRGHHFYDMVSLIEVWMKCSVASWSHRCATKQIDFFMHLVPCIPFFVPTCRGTIQVFITHKERSMYSSNGNDQMYDSSPSFMNEHQMKADRAIWAYTYIVLILSTLYDFFQWIFSLLFMRKRDTGFGMQILCSTPPITHTDTLTNLRTLQSLQWWCKAQ